MAIQGSAGVFDVVRGTSLAGRQVETLVNNVAANIVSATFDMGAFGSFPCTVVDGLITVPWIDETVTARWPLGQLRANVKVVLDNGISRVWVYWFVNVLP